MSFLQRYFREWSTSQELRRRDRVAAIGTAILLVLSYLAFGLLTSLTGAWRTLLPVLPVVALLPLVIATANKIVFGRVRRDSSAAPPNPGPEG